MKFIVKTADIAKQRDSLAVVGVFADGSSNIDNASLAKLVADLIKVGDFTGDSGQQQILPCPTGLNCERLLLVGLGSCDAQGQISESQFNKAIQAVAATGKKCNAKNATIYFDTIQVKDRDSSWQAQQTAEKMLDSQYSFDQLKSSKSKVPSLSKITLSAARKQHKALTSGCETGSAISLGRSLCRDLGNLPGNVCTPTYLAKEAKRLARGNKSVSCKVLEEKHMQELGMGSLLSVSAGSDEPAKLIQLEYKGAAKTQKPLVLVGKGITFDTGGISLKPGAGMDEMKFDMCGAASVLGTMQALIKLELPINVVAIVAASENMPNGHATKPGDIVTSMAGKTIEVLNTDAEGRLVLCDALTYAERFKPAAVIDVATLTGACVIALGKHATGMYSNSEELAAELLEAGQSSGDRAWRMPLWDEYQQQLKSNFADLANIGGREAGSVTAACFLANFTEKYNWAHLDIAGTAWLSGGQKGATGRPVSLLMQYLINKSASKSNK